VLRGLPASAVLAGSDLGALKFILPNRVIDPVGIASPNFRREVDLATTQGRARSSEEAVLQVAGGDGEPVDRTRSGRIVP
jgi:hypothetical protein